MWTQKYSRARRLIWCRLNGTLSCIVTNTSPPPGGGTKSKKYKTQKLITEVPDQSEAKRTNIVFLCFWAPAPERQKRWTFLGTAPKTQKRHPCPWASSFSALARGTQRFVSCSIACDLNITNVRQILPFLTHFLALLYLLFCVVWHVSTVWRPSGHN